MLMTSLNLEAANCKHTLFLLSMINKLCGMCHKLSAILHLALFKSKKLREKKRSTQLFLSMGSWPSKVRKSSNKSVNPSSRSDKEECGEVNHNGTVNHQNHDRHLTSQDSTTPERQTAHPKTQLNQLACRGRKQCSIPFLHPFEILTDGSLNYAVFALLTYRPYLQLFNMVMD